MDAGQTSAGFCGRGTTPAGIIGTLAGMRRKGEPAEESELNVAAFAKDCVPAVRGMLYRPSATMGAAAGEALGLGHGPGPECRAPPLGSRPGAVAKTGFRVPVCRPA